jgi:hypothetical protein
MDTALANLKEILAGQYDDARNFFAILDAARDASISRRLRYESEAISLYRGEPEESLSETAPYLVSLGGREDLVSWILREGWHNSWGILFSSSAGLEALRRHFRRFLLVLDPDGNELYFRFYDPRVLRVYLPTCSSTEVRTFYGPVSAFLVESENGSSILEYSWSGGRVIPLTAVSTSQLDYTLVQNPGRPEMAAGGSKLRIRTEQMKAFSDYMNRDFEKRAMGYLRTEFAVESRKMTDQQLAMIIQDGSGKASAYGLVRENEIGIFLELMMLFGPQFDRSEDWAVDTLSNPVSTPEQKIVVLEQHKQTELKRRADRL